MTSMPLPKNAAIGLVDAGVVAVAPGATTPGCCHPIKFPSASMIGVSPAGMTGTVAPLPAEVGTIEKGDCVPPICALGSNDVPVLPCAETAVPPRDLPLLYSYQAMPATSTSTPTAMAFPHVGIFLKVCTLSPTHD